MIPAYIFDIDGTLADCSHRLHHIMKRPKDWPAFFAACTDDKPIPHMIRLAGSMLNCFHETSIIFVSGRSDECRTATAKWLSTYLPIYINWREDDLEDTGAYKLYMRKAGDRRDDDVVKMELLAQVRTDGFEPIMVFEDRSRVVKAWRAAGVPCAQVADGDF
jgi:phosphoglycolate phosphatase-like HAD superfamily hydrolase